MTISRWSATLSSANRVLRQRSKLETALYVSILKKNELIGVFTIFRSAGTC
jgi:hypothetical protein